MAGSTRLPLVHLDALYWRTPRQQPNTAAWHIQLAQALAQPKWIKDGHYPSSLALRLQRADAAIYLDYPRYLAVWRVLQRTWQPQRADGLAATQLPQRDWRFMQRVWRYRSLQRPQDLALLDGFAGPQWRFTQPAQLQQWLQENK